MKEKGRETGNTIHTQQRSCDKILEKAKPLTFDFKNLFMWAYTKGRQSKQRVVRI